MLDWKGHAKLVDFGLSKKLPTKKVQTHSFIGTKGYMSPEVYHHKGHNYLSDAYHLGIFIYDLIHKEMPFTLSNLDAEGKMIPQITFKSGTSKELKELVTMLVGFDPENRLGGEDRMKSVLLHPWFGDIGRKAFFGEEMTPRFVPDFRVYHFDDKSINERLEEVNLAIEGRRC